MGPQPLIRMRHARVCAKAVLAVVSIVLVLDLVVLTNAPSMDASGQAQFVAANLDTQGVAPFGPPVACTDDLRPADDPVRTRGEGGGIQPRVFGHASTQGLEFRLRSAIAMDRTLVVESLRIIDIRMFVASVEGSWRETRRSPDEGTQPRTDAADPSFGVRLGPDADLRVMVCYRAVPLMQPTASVRTAAGMRRSATRGAASFGVVACVPVIVLCYALVLGRRGRVRVPAPLLFLPLGIVHAAWMLDPDGQVFPGSALRLTPCADWVTAALTVCFLVYIERDIDNAGAIDALRKWRRACSSAFLCGGVAGLLDPQSGFDILACAGSVVALVALFCICQVQEHSRHTAPLFAASLYLLAMYSTLVCGRVGWLPSEWADRFSAPLVAAIALTIGIHLELQARDRARYRELRLRQEHIQAKTEAEVHAAGRLRLFASANHDLRQPVQSFGILATLLKAKAREPAIAQIAQRLVQSYDSLSTQVDGLLDVARLEAGAMRPQVSVFPLEEMLGRLAGEYRDVAACKGLELRHVPCRVHVRSDIRLLERVLRNLLANAVEHTEQGRVLLGARRRPGGRIELQVIDSGAGLQPDVRQGLMAAEYRPRERQGRAGLGLFIVMELAAVLEHPINVTSRVGRGSCFGIELRMEALGVQAQGCAAPPAPELSGLRVLCLDDDATLLDSLRLLLESRHCRVRIARNRRQALDSLVDGFAPDVAIVDSVLISDDGAAVLAHLERLLGRAIPGILLSGSVSPEMMDGLDRVDRSMARKPVDAETLLGMVAALSERGGARRSSRKPLHDAENPGYGNQFRR